MKSIKIIISNRRVFQKPKWFTPKGEMSATVLAIIEMLVVPPLKTMDMTIGQEIRILLKKQQILPL